MPWIVWFFVSHKVVATNLQGKTALWPYDMIDIIKLKPQEGLKGSTAKEKLGDRVIRQKTLSLWKKKKTRRGQRREKRGQCSITK